jgi:hypothetical protein
MDREKFRCMVGTSSLGAEVQEQPRGMRMLISRKDGRRKQKGLFIGVSHGSEQRWSDQFSPTPVSTAMLDLLVERGK